MRLYTFTHFILSSIQQGIQSGHVLPVIMCKYSKKNKKEFKALCDWAPSPTIICLNGGNSTGLKAISEQVENLAKFLKLPYADFFEDKDTLEGIRTSVGVIVPPHIYEAAAEMRGGDVNNLPTGLHNAEIELAMLINSCQLAR